MINKVELIFGAISIGVVITALLLVRDTVTLSVLSTQNSQVATVQSGVQTETENDSSTDTAQALQTMEINDVRRGEGPVVKIGDTVSVHYTGSFQDGQVFDSSKNRGTPFQFTVGAGQVIPGWEQGLLGMRVGGERTLVVPPELAYGEQGIGPIPGNTTLLFTIELLEING